MSSSSDYLELLQMVFQSEKTIIAIECTEEAAVRKAITKCKNERGLPDWRYYKLRYHLTKPDDEGFCHLEISKYKVVKTALLPGV